MLKKNIVEKYFIKSVNVFLSILFMVFLSITNVQSQETNFQGLKLKSNVKSYILKTYIAQKEALKISKESLAYNEYELVTFGTNGNISEINYYNSIDTFISKKLYQYDSNNNLAKVVFTDSTNQLYEYDTNGNQIKFSEYNNNDELVGLEMYEFDVVGNRTSATSYNTNKFELEINGAIASITNYKYDDLGNKIEEINYNSKEVINYKVTFKYDNKNIAEMESFDTEGKLSSKSTFKYDDKNNVSEVNVFIETPPLTEIEEVNENGVKYTQETTYASDELYLENVITYTYKYDSRGNWIEKIKIENEIPMEITTREFVYY